MTKQDIKKLIKVKRELMALMPLKFTATREAKAMALEVRRLENQLSTSCTQEVNTNDC